MEVNKIKQYFLNKNLIEIDEDEIRNLEIKPTLAFTDGENKIFIKILPAEAISNRSQFIKFMMETSALREQCNMIYIVIPSLIATIIDSEILKEMGIGLIISTGEKIREVLPAKKYKPKIILEANLIEQIEQISSRLERIESYIYRLESQINQIAKRIGEAKPIKPITIEKPVEAKIEIPGLPSYMQNNPWLQILKGRGEREIAK